MLGVDLSKETRRSILNNYASECGVAFDADEFIFHTPFFSEAETPARLLPFVEFMIGIQRMTFLTRKNVEDVFKDEVVSAIASHFAGEATVVVGRPQVSEIFPDSPADVVVQAPSSKPLAVFIGTSESKALEALLLWSELKNDSSDGANVMLVLDQLKRHTVTNKTLRRAQNRFAVSYFSEQTQDNVFNAMNDLVFNQRHFAR